MSQDVQESRKGLNKKIGSELSGINTPKWGINTSGPEKKKRTRWYRNEIAGVSILAGFAQILTAFQA